MRIWATREAGNNMMQSIDDSQMVVVGEIGPGDWVRVPQTPDFGPLAGNNVVITARWDGFDCPLCDGSANYIKFDTKLIYVIECTSGCDFVWCKNDVETEEG